MPETIVTRPEAWGTHAQKWDEEGDNETLLINAAVVEFDMDVFIHEKKCEERT